MPTGHRTTRPRTVPRPSPTASTARPRGSAALRTAAARTAFGHLLVADTAIGVCFAEFGPDAATLRTRLAELWPNTTLRRAQPHERPARVLKALLTCLEGKGPCPTTELDLRGTDFRIKVWRMLQRVKPGRTLSYTELARRLGKPSAIRAVASACGANTVALLVPCHRILRSDGTLGGYRWGLPLKQHLLEHEKRAGNALE